MDTLIRPYPGFSQKQVATAADRHRENIDILGYSVMENVLSAEQCAWTAARLRELWEQQEQEFGTERLRSLGEIGTHRGLLREDAFFRDLVLHPQALEIVESILGPTCILNLQNASAAFPSMVNFQSRMHRDFAKDFVATTPLSLNAFWCITEFTFETGATQVVPFSHRMPTIPSDEFVERNAITVVAPAGSIIFWDSLLLHKAGYNSTDSVRYGINHMYTKPFLKQQVDYPVYLADIVTDRESKLAQKLGFWTIPPKSIVEFRCDPDKRTYRGGQG